MDKTQDAGAVLSPQGSSTAHLERLPSQPPARLAGTEQRSAQAAERIELSIVSNSLLLRDGLAVVLAQYISMKLVGHYNDQTVLDPPLPNPPDHVVLLDGSMAQPALLRWIRYWRAQLAPAHVVMLHLQHDMEQMLAWTEAGASACILQSAPMQCLAALLVLVRQDLAYCIPDSLTPCLAQLARQHQNSTTVRVLPPSLTPREVEVLQYLADGRSNKEIAALLIVEVRTVKHYVHNILEKLEMHHRWEVAHLAIEQGWVRPRAR